MYLLFGWWSWRLELCRWNRNTLDQHLAVLYRKWHIGTLDLFHSNRTQSTDIRGYNKYSAINKLIHYIWYNYSHLRGSNISHKVDRNIHNHHMSNYLQGNHFHLSHYRTNMIRGKVNISLLYHLLSHNNCIHIYTDIVKYPKVLTNHLNRMCINCLLHMLNKWYHMVDK